MHNSASGHASRISSNYARLQQRWAAGIPTLTDGGIGSELQAMGFPPREQVDEGQRNFTWGAMALYENPDLVREMHRRYVDAGAEILLTNTFLFHRCVQLERDGDLDVPSGTWQEMARRSVRLAREAAAQAGRPELAVVFSMMIQDGPKEEWGYNGPSYARGTRDWEARMSLDYLRELCAALESEPPDALLVELAPPLAGDQFEEFKVLIASGFPLWVAYRRTVGGPVQIFGDPDTPDGDAFGHAAEEMERIGVSALLVHCLPAEDAHGVAPWLREFTSLPLGVYPNNGRYDMWEWRWEHDHTPAEMAEHARGYAEEGMQIIGGCCGTRPEHIAAMAAALYQPVEL